MPCHVFFVIDQIVIPRSFIFLCQWYNEQCKSWNHPVGSYISLCDSGTASNHYRKMKGRISREYMYGMLCLFVLSVQHVTHLRAFGINCYVHRIKTRNTFPTFREMEHLPTTFICEMDPSYLSQSLLVCVAKLYRRRLRRN